MSVLTQKEASEQKTFELTAEPTKVASPYNKIEVKGFVVNEFPMEDNQKGQPRLNLALKTFEKTPKDLNVILVGKEKIAAYRYLLTTASVNQHEKPLIAVSGRLSFNTSEKGDKHVSVLANQIDSGMNSKFSENKLQIKAILFPEKLEQKANKFGGSFHIGSVAHTEIYKAAEMNKNGFMQRPQVSIPILIPEKNAGELSKLDRDKKTNFVSIEGMLQPYTYNKNGQEVKAFRVVATKLENHPKQDKSLFVEKDESKAQAKEKEKATTVNKSVEKKTESKVAVKVEKSVVAKSKGMNM